MTSVLIKPCNAVRKFFLAIKTRSCVRSKVYPMTSKRTPCSVLSSATAPDPNKSVHILLVMAKSDSRSLAKHTPMMSSTYMTVLLLKACRSSHVIARVTTWNAAGVPDHPKMPANWKYTTSSVNSMAKRPTSSGLKDSKVYAPFRSIFHILTSSHRRLGSRSFAAAQKSYTIIAMFSIVGWCISP